MWCDGCDQNGRNRKESKYLAMVNRERWWDADADDGREGKKACKLGNVNKNKQQTEPRQPQTCILPSYYSLSQLQALPSIILLPPSGTSNTLNLFVLTNPTAKRHLNSIHNCNLHKSIVESCLSFHNFNGFCLQKLMVASHWPTYKMTAPERESHCAAHTYISSRWVIILITSAPDVSK